MKVSELRQATRIWDLAASDIGVKGLTFSPEDGVYFDGMHSGAQYKRTDFIDGLDHPITVNGSTLASVLSFLDGDAELSMAMTADAVSLSAGSHHAVIAASEGSTFRHEDLPESIPMQIQAGDELLRTVRLAAGTTAKYVTGNPALLGISLKAAAGKLVLRSCDGVGRAFIARLLVKGGDLDCLVQGEDIVTAIKVLSGEDLTVVMAGTTLCLAGGDCSIYLSTLNATFPDLGKLPRKFKHKLKLSGALLDLLVRAATTFQSDNLVNLRVADGELSAHATGNELGGLDIDLGKTDESDIQLVYDATLLAYAADLGSEVALQYNDASSPTMLTGTSGYYWLSPVIQQRA